MTATRTPDGYVRMPEGLRKLPWSVIRADTVLDRVTIAWSRTGISTDVTRGAEAGCIIRWRRKDISPCRMEWRGTRWDEGRKCYGAYVLSVNGEEYMYLSDPMWATYPAAHGRGAMGANWTGD